MKAVNRQWLLRRRPSGTAVPEDFGYQEVSVEQPSLRPGEIFLKNAMFGLAPTIRNWMDEPGNSFYPSINLGDPVLAPSGGLVVASADSRYPVGSRVSAISSWQDYEVIDTETRSVRPMVEGLSYSHAKGPLGLNSLNAYVGVLEVGRPRA